MNYVPSARRLPDRVQPESRPRPLLSDHQSSQGLSFRGFDSGPVSSPGSRVGRPGEESRLESQECRALLRTCGICDLGSPRKSHTPAVGTTSTVAPAPTAPHKVPPTGPPAQGCRIPRSTSSSLISSSSAMMRSSTTTARSPTAGASRISRSGKSISKASRTLVASWTAKSECPPSSKKLS